jgi:diacylglycerol kinase family enzyme
VKHVAVVYNARSGALLSGRGDSPEERLTELFGRHGVSARLQAFDPATVAEDVRDLLADEGPDALIVAGGDGTVRTVAGQLTGSSVPLGILPAGTMNVLARDLGIPLDLDAATAALLAAPAQKIDVAAVNGEPFLCHSTLAMMPHLGRLRERARGSLGWRTLRLVGKATRILWRYPRKQLTVVVDGARHVVRTRAIVVSSNPLSTGQSRRFGRERLDTGVLMVYVAQDKTNWDLLAVARKLFDGTWQQDERLQTYQGQTVEILSPTLTLMSVMSDGEIEQLGLPLKYEIRPRALAVLAPRGVS